MHEVVRQVMSLCAPPSSIEVAAVLKRSTHAVCKYVCIYACAYPSAVGRFERGASKNKRPLEEEGFDSYQYIWGWVDLPSCDPPVTTSLLVLTSTPSSP